MLVSGKCLLLQVPSCGHVIHSGHVHAGNRGPVIRVSAGNGGEGKVPNRPASVG